MGYVQAVTIELDRPREFRLSFLTLRRFEMKTGKTLQYLMRQMEALQDESGEANEDSIIEMLGALVWAGCGAGDESLTLDTVLDNLGLDPTEQLRPVFEAIGRALPAMEAQTPLDGTTPMNRAERRHGNGSGGSA